MSCHRKNILQICILSLLEAGNPEIMNHEKTDMGRSCQHYFNLKG